jgi:two-component system, OmpR family, sensor kinase
VQTLYVCMLCATPYCDTVDSMRRGRHILPPTIERVLRETAARRARQETEGALGQSEALLTTVESLRERTAELEAANRELKAAVAERDRLLAREQSVRLQAEAAQRRRDEFASIASHELKTPLTVLKLQLQLLYRMLDPAEVATVPPARLLRVIGIGQQHIARLTRLTSELLDVSQTGIPHGELSHEDVDLCQLVRDVVAMLAEGQGLDDDRVRVSAPDCVVGCWDRFRLERVVANLLTNATKFGAEKPVDITVTATGPTAELTVADRGIGIAPEDLDRIFERFERAVPAQDYGGLGLGLYVARQIVEAHGGTITVTSAPNAGTSFRVELPLHVPVSASSAPARGENP